MIDDYIATDIDQFRNKLRAVGIAVFKSFLSLDESNLIKECFIEKFNSNKPIVRSGPNLYNRHDYLRFDCGDFSQCNARLSYMHALFPWNKDLTNSPIQ